ncbi:MAG: sigma-70 family RNA polymerase sigma factor [Myroides sp.]|jgi:RNA polymerase sigma-70 factor (ECF subfamily)|nr:sigma-70 family RNA polymerase sigma factor [Myroides sp.]
MTRKDRVERGLVDRLQSKDQSAWKEFYEFYSGHFTYVCMRYLKSQDDVKDVMQNSFIKMFNAIGSFEYKGVGSLKAWTTRLLINESLKFLRDTNAVEFPNLVEDIPDLEQGDETDLEDIPESVILDLIRSLPDGYRMVFNLYVFEKKSHKEIGRLLEIGESSSASQFHRAKKMLIQKIKLYNKPRISAL